MESVMSFMLGLLLGLVVLLWLRARWQAQQADLLARAEAMSAQLAQAGSERDEGRRQVEALSAELTGLYAKQSALEMQLVKEREAAAEKLVLLQDAERKLADAFRALSSDALKSNNQAFLDLAKQQLATQHESAKGELEQRRQAVDALVKPIHDALEKLGGHAQAMEKERVGAYAALMGAKPDHA